MTDAPVKSEHYLRIAHQLKRGYLKACFQERGGTPFEPVPYDDMDDEVTWLDVAEWLLSTKRKQVAPGTWILYRNAVKHVAEDPQIDRMLAVKPMLRNKDVRKRTSAKRQKHFKPDDLAKLENWIGTRERKLTWGNAALAWIKATLLTGLRPHEWADAQIILLPGDIQALRVKTAKIENHAGATCLPRRTIRLDHLDEQELNIIIGHYSFYQDVMKLGGVQLALYSKSCNDVICRGAREIWPRREKRPSIYSARHQFAANLKAADLRPVEIATLLGHGSLHTQKNNYGGKISGLPVSVPEPIPEEVEELEKYLEEKSRSGRAGGNGFLKRRAARRNEHRTILTEMAKRF